MRPASKSRAVSSRNLHPEPERCRASRAQISLDDAIAIVLAANPGAGIIEVDLDGRSDDLRYQVEIRSGTDVLEVRVDAVTGDILSTPEDSDADDDSDDDDDDDDAESDDDD